MTQRAAIELDVFSIIAKSGPEAHLTSKEIVSEIPTTDSNAEAENLERILKASQCQIPPFYISQTKPQ